MRSITVTSAGLVNGRLKIRYGKVEEDLGENMEDVRAWMRAIVGGDEGADRVLLAIGMAAAFASGNPQSIVGKTITFNASLANIVRIT